MIYEQRCAFVAIALQLSSHGIIGAKHHKTLCLQSIISTKTLSKFFVVHFLWLKLNCRFLVICCYSPNDKLQLGQQLLSHQTSSTKCVLVQLRLLSVFVLFHRICFIDFALFLFFTRPNVMNLSWRWIWRSTLMILLHRIQVHTQS